MERLEDALARARAHVGELEAAQRDALAGGVSDSHVGSAVRLTALRFHGEELERWTSLARGDAESAGHRTPPGLVVTPDGAADAPDSAPTVRCELLCSGR